MELFRSTDGGTSAPAPWAQGIGRRVRWWGGQLAITTWGPDVFEPMYSAFDQALSRERPDLVSHFRPWDRLTEVTAVEKLLIDGGATEIEVDAEEGHQSQMGPESWWNVTRGSGMRATVEAMGPKSAERVRARNMALISQHGVTSDRADCQTPAKRDPTRV